MGGLLLLLLDKSQTKNGQVRSAHDEDQDKTAAVAGLLTSPEKCTRSPPVCILSCRYNLVPAPDRGGNGDCSGFLLDRECTLLYS